MKLIISILLIALLFNAFIIFNMSIIKKNKLCTFNSLIRYWKFVIAARSFPSFYRDWTDGYYRSNNNSYFIYTNKDGMLEIYPKLDR